jgi:hypothetical protein
MTEPRWLKHSIAAAVISSSLIVPIPEVPAVSFYQTVVGTSETDLSEERHSIGTADLQRSSRWREYVQQRLLELSEARFDFSELMVPTGQTVDQARSVADSLFRYNTPTPSVVPSEDGAVLFVWRRDGWDVELEVTALTADVWARRRADGLEWHGPLNDRGEQFSDLLEEFSASV